MGTESLLTAEKNMYQWAVQLAEMAGTARMLCLK